MKDASEYGLKPFEDLQTSTTTVMVYSNVIFNTRRIFENIKITKIDSPLTKKQKNVDKKKINAPYGSIISVQSKTHIRGLDLRKKKKKWCTICQPVKTVDDSKIQVLTVTERLKQENDTDIYAIMYYCSACDKEYYPSDMKKINHFLNQLTIVISVGNQPLLNIMMFKDNLKFAGCKNINDAVEAILVLWQDYIFTGPSDLWSLKKGAKNPRFIFETVMRNVDFKIGWPIERPALNYLMNKEIYSKYIFMSQYESTGHTNVNIKMFSRKPKDFKYDCLVVPIDSSKEPYFIQLDDIPYKSDKKKAKDLKYDKYVTFIAFSSSEIILSGRYDENMKDMYNFFVHTVFTHKLSVEEKMGEIEDSKLRKIKKQT